MTADSWKSDHQSWQKDIKVWEKEHALVRAAINELVDKLRTYDAVLDYHQHQIADHGELMALHGEAMSWNAKNSGSSRGHEISDLLQLEEESHVREAGVHQRLRELHQDVLRVSLDAVMRLGTLV